MDLYSQRDNEWGNDRIGKTNYTLARWGCTITALCMLLSKWYKNAEKPPEAARMWAFGSTGDDAGKIYWTRSKFNGMAFVWRGYGHNHNKIMEYAKAEDKGVIIEVNKNHWVVATGVRGGGVSIHDPWDGKKYDSMPTKYKITGYALFKKTKRKNGISDYAESSVKKSIEKAIALKWDDPKKIVAGADTEAMFMKAGILNREKATGHITKEDMAVIFDRLGLLD
jgi:ABC-type bacteriocin/lantibiotic exporter with double-glycine peptidase domain